MRSGQDALRATHRYAGGYALFPSAIRDNRKSANSVGGIAIYNEMLGEGRRAQNTKKCDRGTMIKLLSTITTQHPTLPQHCLFLADGCFGTLRRKLTLKSLN